MSNISQISKAKRLTEEEVHAAAEELQEAGSKVSCIEVYRFLGRGSLTTITNFLKTWKQEESVTTLPALISLPESLSKSAEQLIIKLWSESQTLAEKEINSQREALRQAETVAAEKIKEAEAFSEEQSRQIEALEALIDKINKDREEQCAELLKRIEIEQDERHRAVTKEAVTTSKLIEAEKRFDYVNAALIEQQQANQTLTAENITLKATIEVQYNQINQLTIDLKNQEERTAGEANDNKSLREKAAKLEGELIAWKEIKPEAKKPETKKANAGRNVTNRNNIKTESSETGKKEFKKTEWTEEKL